MSDTLLGKCPDCGEPVSWSCGQCEACIEFGEKHPEVALQLHPWEEDVLICPHCGAGYLKPDWAGHIETSKRKAPREMSQEERLFLADLLRRLGFLGMDISQVKSMEEDIIRNIGDLLNRGDDEDPPLFPGLEDGEDISF